MRRHFPHALRALVAVLALTIFVVPSAGDTELILVDGRVLRGVDVRRDGGVYVLIREDGSEIALPMELVEGVRLIGKREPKSRMTKEGLRISEAQQLAGTPIPEGPTGMRSDGPETLAGAPVRPPSRSKQLEVLGKPSQFQKNIIDNSWEPSTDWNMDPEEQNNFAPSTWAKDIVDHSWEPESAFDANADVLKDSRSTFQKGVIDSSWAPTDGFATSVGRP